MKDKIEIYAMIVDALQSANGLRHQVQEIQKAIDIALEKSFSMHPPS